jgi:nucleotide-binding universal stress UspA family protein
MTDMPANDKTAATFGAPVLFAYDGSELAALAIERAGRELASGRDALVLCVWQPGGVGFVPVTTSNFDANAASEVRLAAQETAEFGASLARHAGFRAQGAIAEAAPTWKGIIDTAKEHRVSLIVMGAHSHAGLVGHLLGSVSAAVVSHAACSVLVVHQGS